MQCTCPHSATGNAVYGCQCSSACNTVRSAALPLFSTAVTHRTHTHLCISHAETHKHAHTRSGRQQCSLFSSSFNACGIVCGGQSEIDGNFCQILYTRSQTKETNKAERRTAHSSIRATGAAAAVGSRSEFVAIDQLKLRRVKQNVMLDLKRGGRKICWRLSL